MCHNSARLVSAPHSLQTSSQFDCQNVFATFDTTAICKFIVAQQTEIHHFLKIFGIEYAVRTKLIRNPCRCGCHIQKSNVAVALADSKVLFTEIAKYSNQGIFFENQVLSHQGGIKFILIRLVIENAANLEGLNISVFQFITESCFYISEIDFIHFYSDLYILARSFGL